MLAFYTVVWTMHSEDDRAFFQQLYIDYELMMFKKALTVLRNEEESLDAVSDACLMLMKRISTLRQLSDMSLRRYIIITVETCFDQSFKTNEKDKPVFIYRR